METLYGMVSHLRSGTGHFLAFARPMRPALLRLRHRVEGPRGEVTVVIMALSACMMGLVWHELRTSELQSRLFARYAAKLSWQVEPGRSPSIVFPKGGPFDERRGYAALPGFSRRLEQRGFAVKEQARFSKDLAWLAGHGIAPPGREPGATGLVIVGSDGDTLFDATPHGTLIESYEQIPPKVVNSLLYLENRELGAPPDPRSNPVLDWGRLTKAGLLYAGHGLGLPLRIEGGSTLAIQLEKFRHSGDGQTESPVDKLRQIVGASLRAYQSGPDTREARREIVLDYLNTMPLAAAPGVGEVNGLADGLRVWFGRDLKRTFATLSETQPGKSEPEAFKHVLALLYAVRAPSWYLVRDRAALEARVNGAVTMLQSGGVLDSTFAGAVRRAPLHFTSDVERDRRMSSASAKASNMIRCELKSLLDVPDFYALNRLNLDAASTIDVGLEHKVTRLFEQLGDTSFVSAHGLRAKHLLEVGDPAQVVYGLQLYESTPRGNMLRVHADNLDRPFDMNRSMKMELGSTAKLRTLAHYLEIVVALHGEMMGLDPEERARLALEAPDPLTRWAADTLAHQPGLGIKRMLSASLERTYPATPYEEFFTGGGIHTFSNFDPADDSLKCTVREAAARSVNLVFVRLMRDLVRYHQARLPYDATAVMWNERDPMRGELLAQIGDEEARIVLWRAWKRYRRQAPREIERRLLGTRATSPRALSAAWHAWRADGDARGRFEGWLAQRVPKLSRDQVAKAREAYNNPRYTLLDYGVALGRHPMDVWCAGALERDRNATYQQLLDRSGSARTLASAWLLETSHKRAQAVRLRNRIERDAFARMLPSWKALGFPFDKLVPSYATALGSSSDRPAALAELMGIIVNDGMRLPSSSVQRLSFGADTPYHTTFEPEQGGGERVMAVPVARALRSVLAGVVDHGTAQRVKGAWTGADGEPLIVGGKTGSGDNRFETFGRGGQTLTSRSTNRTAAFVFYIGERHFGVITASVLGSRSGEYTFTSSLPLAVLRLLAPSIQRELVTPPDPTATALSVATSH